MTPRRRPAPGETSGPQPEQLAPTEPGSGDASRPGEQPRPAGRRRRGYWIPGLIAVAALTAIGVALGAGDLNHRSPQVLYGRDVAQQIALGIQAREGTHTPPQVRCPATVPVRQGWPFVCTRSEAGKGLAIQVVEIDNRGRLRWSGGG